MHPVLLNKKLVELLPADLYKALGPKGYLMTHWQWWVGGLIVAIAIAWWGLAPDAKGGRRAVGWLGTLGAFAMAVMLGGIGLGRLQYIQLHTYGVLVAVGFLIGIVLAVREARRVHVDAERILDLAFWLLIAAMVGARAFYIALHWGDYAQDFAKVKIWYQWKVFRLWEGGLLFYGGFVLALIICWLFVRLYKMNFWKLADIMIPSVAIGQVFGMLGSYAAGFSYGKVAGNVPWKVVYEQGAAVRGVALHPTQLYEALGVLALFLFLLWLRSAKKFHGQVFLWYLLIYPAMSFFIDIFRGDDASGFLTKIDITPIAAGTDLLSWSQAISIALFAFAALKLLSTNPKEAASS